MSSNGGRLLERAAQLALLDEDLAAVRASGRGRLAFVAGEAGAGKSALIRQFCITHADSVQVLMGACDALFTPRPLGPLLDIAQITGGELEELTAARRPPVAGGRGAHARAAFAGASHRRTRRRALGGRSDF